MSTGILSGGANGKGGHIKKDCSGYIRHRRCLLKGECYEKVMDSI